MNLMHPRCACFCILIGLAVLAGCSKPAPPPRVPVSGTVTIEGKPLPQAVVTFYPLFEGFGSELVAEGTTDASGRFTLASSLGEGACVGRHRVTVNDAPAPEDARGQTAEAQKRLARHINGLENRPIGSAFQTVGSSPLEIEISEDGSPYELKLSH